MFHTGKARDRAQPRRIRFPAIPPQTPTLDPRPTAEAPATLGPIGSNDLTAAGSTSVTDKDFSAGFGAMKARDETSEPPEPSNLLTARAAGGMTSIHTLNVPLMQCYLDAQDCVDMSSLLCE